MFVRLIVLLLLYLLSFLLLPLRLLLLLYILWGNGSGSSQRLRSMTQDFRQALEDLFLIIIMIKKGLTRTYGGVRQGDVCVCYK